ncbi:MAG TPA: transporter substrate-binding domain-containing protein, partial [Nevskiaceae bacterium]
MLCAPPLATAQAPAAGADDGDVLAVGVKIAPPFVIKEGDRYTGLAIEVWEAAAKEHHWRYRFRQFDLAGLLAATRDGQIAAGLGAVTATAERERHMDFSHTLVSSGLAIAVARNPTPGWMAMLQALTTPGFLAGAGGLLLVLLIVATLMWAFERRGNPAQFNRGPARGIGSGLWWAGVTAATVGYGDKIPRSLPGRLVALAWMFIALVAVSAFTATITTALTVEHLEGRVRSPSDLPYARVATVAGTTSAQWLAEHHIAFTAAASAEQALIELREGHVDAVVYDAPLLSYL